MNNLQHWRLKTLLREKENKKMKPFLMDKRVDVSVNVNALPWSCNELVTRRLIPWLFLSTGIGFSSAQAFTGQAASDGRKAVQFFLIGQVDLLLQRAIRLSSFSWRWAGERPVLSTLLCGWFKNTNHMSVLLCEICVLKCSCTCRGQ